MSSTRLLRPYLSHNYIRHNAAYQHPTLVHTRTYLRPSAPLLSSWSPSPAPPRLPKEDQELFERLQARSTGAFSTPATDPNTSSQDTDTVARGTSAPSRAAVNQVDARVNASGQGEELHPDIRRGAKDEFDGERNPVTGEVGGPKKEPLRWGHAGDWSYNGRVTDF